MHLNLVNLFSNFVLSLPNHLSVVGELQPSVRGALQLPPVVFKVLMKTLHFTITLRKKIIFGVKLFLDELFM